jgi:hypothetical protein
MQFQAMDGLTDEGIKIDFVDQFLFRVYRLIGKMDGKQFLLQTVFLTFEDPTLPNTVKVGYERNTVHPKSNTIFSLQLYGLHGAISQKMILLKTTTVKTSNPTSNENGCSEASCLSQPHCMNCNRVHPSSDESWPVYMNERPIQEL